ERKKVATKKFADADYFDILIEVPFYAGFRAVIVDSRMGAIRKHFPNYKTVADYGPKRVKEILGDPQMIQHAGKIQASVDNARTFKAIIDQQGSFQKYVDSFDPRASFENLMRLRQDLIRRFRYLGKITAYHFLTNIGMPVLKPDRVIRRIFYRLGLIESEGESEEQLLKVVYQGHQFAQATNHPIRYIDIVFVAYGQVQFPDFGIEQGICLKDNPQCAICGVSKYCQYFAQTVQGKRR
ncbi:MAG TPA: DNA-3-methyladenine glycosylase I, partial [Nitrososphaera sp.]|nr:DNA-3-methyladenine glycosylase I [Nitrososphaera sp.]